MKPSAFRYAVVLAAALLVAAWRSTGPAPAWPQVVLFHGPRLPAPIALAGVETTMAFMGAIVAGKGSTLPLSDRRGYEVAIFWSPSLRGCAVDPRCPARLRPEDADEHAVYYPRRGDGPAILRWIRRADGSVLRMDRVEDAGLAVLARHGIPIDE